MVGEESGYNEGKKPDILYTPWVRHIITVSGDFWETFDLEVSFSTASADFGQGRYEIPRDNVRLGSRIELSSMKGGCDGAEWGARSLPSNTTGSIYRYQ